MQGFFISLPVSSTLAGSIKLFLSTPNVGSRDGAGKLIDDGQRCMSCTALLRALPTGKRATQSQLYNTKSDCPGHKNIGNFYVASSVDTENEGGIPVKRARDYVFTVYSRRAVLAPAPVIMFHFMRFLKNPADPKGILKLPAIKLHDAITLDDILDMRPFMADATGGKVSYRLRSIVCHRGASVAKGHNVTYSRDGDSDFFFLYDDGCTVKRLTAAAVAAATAREVFIAMYERM
jgi:hypothetical protein